MKKQKISKQEQEFWIEFDEKVKEEARFLVDKLQENIDRGEIRDENGNIETVVREKYCGHVEAQDSLAEGETEMYRSLGHTVVSIGDGGRQQALIEELQTAPFIKEREAKALTRVKRKYKLLKLAKGAVKVLGLTLVAGLAVGGVFSVLPGSFFVGKALSTAAGWGAASWGAFSACAAVGLGTAVAMPFIGMNLGEKVAGALDDKESDIHFNATRMEDGYMMSLDSVPREKDIDDRYPKLKGHDRPWQLDELEKGRTMFYEDYVEARIYMAMRDICRERALKEGSQEA